MRGMPLYFTLGVTLTWRVWYKPLGLHLPTRPVLYGSRSKAAQLHSCSPGSVSLQPHQTAYQPVLTRRAYQSSILRRMDHHRPPKHQDKETLSCQLHEARMREQGGSTGPALDPGGLPGSAALILCACGMVAFAKRGACPAEIEPCFRPGQVRRTVFLSFVALRAGLSHCAPTSRRTRPSKMGVL